MKIDQLTKKKIDPLDKIREDFDKLKSKVVTPSTRTVRLTLKSNCGCGDWDVDIAREVPYDSPLKDGDSISEEEQMKGDRIWSD